jgi:hypothetical protein
MNNKQKGVALVKTIIVLASVIILTFAFLAGINRARSAYRDHKRMADIEQIKSALKIYHDYNLKYPESVNGQPRGISSYMQYWPEAPTPADGRCGNKDNVYAYVQLDSGESYSLAFCLGSRTKGWGPGRVELRP